MLRARVRKGIKATEWQWKQIFWRLGKRINPIQGRQRIMPMVRARVDDGVSKLGNKGKELMSRIKS